MSLIEITPTLRLVIANLQAAGGSPMLVGGCVRDALMGNPNPKDIDIECFGITYNDIVVAIRQIGGCDIVGVTFAVVNATINDTTFDISLPRRDSKVGTGHKGFEVEVDHTMTIEEAAARRDFTINAMSWDPFSDELIDPYGGQEDLAAGFLRAINDQFGEDPLRVLRGMQFAGRFDLVMTPDTARMCRQLKDEFHTISKERIWKEFRKLLVEAPRPSFGIRVLEYTGWIEHFPELHATYGVKQDLRWHPEGNVEEHQRQAVDVAAGLGLEDEDRLIAVLSALCHDFGKATHTVHEPDGSITSKGHAKAGVEPTRSFLRRIGAPSWVEHKVLPLVREHMRAVNVEPNRRTVKKLVRDLAPATIVEWSRLVTADSGGRGHDCDFADTSDWVRIAEEMGDDKGPAKAILKGEQLMAVGLKPGPLFGQIIKASIEAQDDDIITDEETAQQWLETHLRSREAAAASS